MTSTELLTLTKLARYLGIPKRTLYDMIKDGRFSVDPIPKTKPRLWNRADVDTWASGAVVR